MFNIFRRMRSDRHSYILIVQVGENMIPWICKDYREAKTIVKNIGIDIDNYVIYESMPIEIMKGKEDGE